VGRFKPVRDGIGALVSAFSTRGAGRSDASASDLPDTRWLANISHELRTPLNIVIGLSDMLINERKLKLDDARRSDYAHLIHASGNHLLSLIDGILEMAKLEAGGDCARRQAFSPAQAIAFCTDMLAFDAKRAGLELRVEVLQILPEVVADQRAFKQILINLLSNAIKFTERGHVKLSAAVEAQELVIRIEDTGVGISAEALPRVGSAFYRARPSGRPSPEGSGLGLSIVKELVNRSGGTFELCSRAGEGTCATVRLPLKTCEANLAASRRSCAQTAAVSLAGRCAHAG
jgi:two-component system, cell cycle sensor histidine kinase DivJ